VGIHEVDRLAPLIVRRDVEIHRDAASPYHTRMHFSFGDYQDPTQMGIGALRVLNHRVLPPAARPALELHAHAVRVAYVIAGALVHRDRNIDDGRVDAGGVQRSALPAPAEALEWNPLPAGALELLDIWLHPRREPTRMVEQRQYHLDDRRNRWLQLARPHGTPGTGVAVDTDVSILVNHVEPGAAVEHTIRAGGGGYAYVISGAADLNDELLRTGDAALITGSGSVVVGAREHTEVVMVDTAL
jgi:redox-sensitive bicupin YhaK (pirin superfamily)